MVSELKFSIKLRRFAVHGKTVRYISIFFSVNTNIFWVNAKFCDITWTEEPGRLQSMRWQRVGHDLVTEHTHAQLILKEMLI